MVNVSLAFLSTPSAGRATSLLTLLCAIATISIHALREEGDLERLSYSLSQMVYFYPRPPRGGRRHHPRLRSGGQKISIHALREEGDGRFSTMAYRLANFYPRPPRGGRHSLSVDAKREIIISIHALREEGDVSASPMNFPLLSISIHALREEGDVSLEPLDTSV